MSQYELKGPIIDGVFSSLRVSQLMASLYRIDVICDTRSVILPIRELKAAVAQATQQLATTLGDWPPHSSPAPLSVHPQYSHA